MSVAMTLSRKDQARARRQRRSQTRGELNALKRGQPTDPKPANDVRVEQAGLEWMLARKKITLLQATAGRRYGRDYRILATEGIEPLKSCLNDMPGGGDKSAFSRATFDVEARQRFQAARLALWQDDMLSACDLVCGRELTPYEVVRLNGGTQRHAEQIVTTLRIALDILAKHYRG